MISVAALAGAAASATANAMPMQRERRKDLTRTILNRQMNLQPAEIKRHAH